MKLALGVAGSAEALFFRGLLDFTVWAAGQMVDEEEMKNFDVRMLAASAVPAAVAGMITLDTPETIGAGENLSSKAGR